MKMIWFDPYITFEFDNILFIFFFLQDISF